VWPAAPPLPTTPFRDDANEDEKPASLRDACASVFRLVKRASGRRTVHGAALGTIVGLAAGRAFAETAEARLLTAAAFVMASAIGGGLLGHSQREDECTGCGARLAIPDTRCTKCSGRIAFEIDASDDRLLAHDLLEAHGDKAAAMYRESRTRRGQRLALRILRFALVSAVLIAILVFLGR
jgi:hypothetical protein